MITVHKIEAVDKHPKADRLDIYTVAGKKCISSRIQKMSGWAPRYDVDQYVLYIPVGSTVSYFLLKDGFWNEDSARPYLGGPNGNIVEKVTLRGVESEGLMIPIDDSGSLHAYELSINGLPLTTPRANDDDSAYTEVMSKDFSDILGIIPPKEA